MTAQSKAVLGSIGGLLLGGTAGALAGYYGQKYVGELRHSEADESAVIWGGFGALAGMMFGAGFGCTCPTPQQVGTSAPPLRFP